MSFEVESRRRLYVPGVDPEPPQEIKKRYEEVVKESPMSAVEGVVELRDILGATIDPQEPPASTQFDWGQYGSPKDVPIDTFFPFPSYRLYQREYIQDILTAFFPKEKGGKGKRFVVLEAPTGSGKSPSGMTIAKASSGAYLSTSQRMLQDQYSKDFVQFTFNGKYEYIPMTQQDSDLEQLRAKLSGMGRDAKDKSERGSIRSASQKEVKAASAKLNRQEQEWVQENPEAVIVLKGKTNYWCPRYGEPTEPTYNCGNAPCIMESNEAIANTIKAQCLNAGICPYYRERARAIAAKNTVVNFKNLLLLSMFRVFPQRHLMIVDECQCLEDTLFDFVDTTISSKSMSAVMELLSVDQHELMKSGMDTAEDVLAFAQDVLTPLIKKKMRLLRDDQNNDADYDDESSDYQRLLNLTYKFEFLFEFAKAGGSIVLIPNMVANENNITKTVQDGYKLKPLSVAQLFDKVFASGRQVLLMSATILDHEAYCKTLGIPLEQVEFIKVPSTFPKENHPFYFRSVGGMGMKDIQATLPRMCAEIERILAFHKNQKGLIHTVNFTPITKFLVEWFAKTEPRMIFHTEGVDKFECIKRHLESPEPTILVGPGFGEGLDLKDDLSRFQIFTKVPFLSLADPIIKKRMEIDAQWYRWRTALSLVQMDGRSCRSAEDTAVSYMLDANFEFFWRQSKTMLPQHFRDRVLVDD